MGRANYFEWLTSLSFDPCVGQSQVNVIRQAVDLWKASLESASGTGDRTAQANLALYDDMMSVMTVKATREKEAKEMKQQQLGKLNAAIDYMASAGIAQISQVQAKAYAEQYRLAPLTTNRAFKDKGITIVGVTLADTRDFLYPMGDYNKLAQALDVVRRTPNPTYDEAHHSREKIEDIYDLLAYLDKLPLPQKSEKNASRTEDLFKRCEAYAIHFGSAADDYSHAMLNAATTGKAIFADDASRQKYDRRIRFSRLTQEKMFQGLLALDDVMLRNPTIAEPRIKEIMAILSDYNQAIAAYNEFTGLGSGQKEPYAGRADAKYTVTCPECGASTEFASLAEAQSKNRCINGHALFRKCGNPSCGKMILLSQTVCSCGFSFASAVYFDGFYRECVDAIGKNDYSTAQAKFEKARSANPFDPRLSDLQKQLGKLEARFREPLDAIRTLMSQGAYFKAQTQMAALKRDFPGVSFTRYEEEIREKIEWAQREWAAASRLTDNEKKVAAAMRILGQVSDFTQASAFAATVRPPKVPTLRIVPVTEGKSLCWRLEWDAAAPGVTYTIMRRAGTKPKAIGDGIKLAEGLQATYFVDKTAKSGVEYGYAIFAIRGTAVSDPTQRLMASLCPELDPSKVMITLNDATCSLSWSVPENCQGVRVYRGTGNGTVSLSSPHWDVTGANVFKDKLTTGQTYRYRLFTLWEGDDDELEMSAEGVMTEPVRPATKPAALSVQAVPAVGGTRIDIQWTKRADAVPIQIIRLADGKTPPNPGSVISQAQMKALGSVVGISDTSMGAMSISSSTNRAYHLLAVLPYSNDALVCNAVVVNTAQPCRILSAAVTNGKLGWSLEVPEGASGVWYKVRTFSDAAQARTARETALSKTSMTWEAASAYAGGRMHLSPNMAEEGVLLLTVVAEYKQGDHSFLSPEAHQNVINLPKHSITYDITWSKRGLFGTRRGSVTVKTEKGEALPELVLGAKTDGSLPLNRSSADVILARIPAGTPSGKSIPLDETAEQDLPRRAMAKLFIERSEDAIRYMQPVPASNVQPKP